MLSVICGVLIVFLVVVVVVQSSGILGLLPGWIGQNLSYTRLVGIL